ncbi:MULTISPECIES: hypothetical protein [unclassified Kitasatospora]|uniref:hypothetical protein n=1 Tax=unclassified Kitasatospora TaxID=2633591 RepID=UPI00070D4D2D|nr:MULTISPECIES: hypothetical protein [unclassified Kitasatospora]KQV18796.1 hypothetical protein ASC99_06295 [Kitasatospora sp. Root107]KRB74778.1 hypothetical protein ASE03_20230 [Kitasatospora sp. Root187]
MPQNPENPEFPEDFDDFEEEAVPVVQEAVDSEREVDEHLGDDYEQLRERRSLGADAADDADASEQVRVVELDEDEYR